ncbi:MAG TPA: phosphate ABC transporter substrate-binding protein [Thermoanaerobaculia bacterium]|nr:phosphate ABC transporter substrate-binding protein [Thermoanaerobaculia bacterium]
MWQTIRSKVQARKTAVGFLGALLIHLMVLGQPSSAEQGFVVIVNLSNPLSAVPREELSRIFLKKSTKWEDGSRTEPVDLAESSPVRARFSQSVHGRDTTAIKAFWQKMIFSGRDVPPAELASTAEVIAFVAARRGAVGYVSEGTSVGERVKVIQIVP